VNESFFFLALTINNYYKVFGLKKKVFLNFFSIMGNVKTCSSNRKIESVSPISL
jgi:hypothetical protein